jgi:uncharacterized phage-associated protein
MPVDVNAVVDRFLSLGHDAGRPLTHIEVQKLLFFLEGWHLATVGDSLFDEEFQAWANGPVIKTVYERLLRYSAHSIPRSEIKALDFAILGSLTLDLISRVFKTYREYDPGALIGLTHLPGTPWAQVRNAHGIAKGATSTVVIPKICMKEWFSEVLHAALEPANDDLVEANSEDYADWAETYNAAE